MLAIAAFPVASCDGSYILDRSSQLVVAGFVTQARGVRSTGLGVTIHQYAFTSAESVDAPCPPPAADSTGRAPTRVDGARTEADGSYRVTVRWHRAGSVCGELRVQPLLPSSHPETRVPLGRLILRWEPGDSVRRDVELPYSIVP